MTIRSRPPCVWRRRRALARISEREMPGVSSMKIFASVSRSRACVSFSLIFAKQESLLDLLRIDQRFRCQHAAQQRFFRHFKREDGDDLVAADRRVLRDVDRPGGLAHGRAGGDDGQLRMLQAAGLLVELVEVGSQAGDLLALLVEVVDGAEGVADDLGDAGETVGDSLFSDFEQRADDAVEDGERIFALVVRLADRERGVLDQLSQERPVFDDADVFLDAQAARQALG